MYHLAHTCSHSTSFIVLPYSATRCCHRTMGAPFLATLHTKPYIFLHIQKTHMPTHTEMCIYCECSRDKQVHFCCTFTPAQEWLYAQRVTTALRSATRLASLCVAQETTVIQSMGLAAATPAGVAPTAA